MNKTKLCLSLDTKESIEKVILLLNLGVITALKDKVITLDEAEQILYSPYTMSKLKKVNVSEEILAIMHMGTELEDVLSLIPDAYNRSIEDIVKRTLNGLRTIEELINVKKIID